MRYGRIITAVVMLAFAGSLLSQEFDAEELRKNGNKWFRLGNYDDAIVSYTKALEIDPKMHKAYNARGEAYLQMDDREHAIQDYTKAIELAPDEPKYYNNRGNAYRELKEYEKALADFNKAVEIDADYETVYFNRCALYRDMGDMDLALADCTKAAELMPLTERVWTRLGLLNMELKNYDDAIFDFSKAISLQGKEIMSAYILRSKAHREKGDWRKAINDMDEALQFDRKNPETMAGLAWLLAVAPDEKLRDGKRALELAQKAAALTLEKNAEALEAAAAASAETGDFEKAVEYEKKAIALLEEGAGERADMEKRLKLYEEKKPYREAQQK